MTPIETDKSKTKKSAELFSSDCDLNKINGRFHFIGIGGIGMSALARLLLNEGKQVSGSDKYVSKITDELATLGAKIFIGHREENAVGSGAAVLSTAITTDNPELGWIQTNGRPIFHRSQILAALANNKKLVAVSGTHGKTTTTAMIGKVLIDAGFDPGIVLGGIFPLLNSNCRAGKSNYFVAEADESDGTHTSLNSEIAVVTNVEADHLENYAHDVEQIFTAMKLFANQSQKVILCLDDPGCLKILPDLKSKIVGYGMNKVKNFKGTAYSFEEKSESTINIYKNDENIGMIELSVPGLHNKYNALAAAVVGLELGIDFSIIASSLKTFSNVDRRFQLIGQHNDILIVDDYAHHPTEVKAVLEAARQYIRQNKFAAKRLVAVFQPHQPGRLKDLWEEFRQAFTNCDLLLLCDVYIARGEAIENINSERFAKEVNHKNCVYLPGKASTLAAQIKEYIKPGDLVITIGAGDITTVGPALSELLSHGRTS